jgi:hypothetical protein
MEFLYNLVFVGESRIVYRIPTFLAKKLKALKYGYMDNRDDTKKQGLIP